MRLRNHTEKHTHPSSEPIIRYSQTSKVNSKDAGLGCHFRLPSWWVGETKAVGLLIRGKGVNRQVHRRKSKEILYLLQGSEDWGKEGASIWIQREKI